MTVRRRVVLPAALAILACGAAALAADVHPSHPMRVVVPFAAGTQVDTVARAVAAPLAAELGQPVIVENRPGASGNIAAELVARAPADGRTLLLAGVTQTIQPAMPGTIALDPTTAFVPVIKLTSQPVLLAAHPDFPGTRLADVVAAARREPGRIAYSTAGVGSSGHLAAAMFEAAARVELFHVPYATTNAIWRDAVAGLVPLTLSPVSGTLPYVHARQLKPIADTGSTRSRALPDTPTFAEAGYPDVDIHSWYGLLAPAGTPPEAVNGLYRALAGILRRPEIQARFGELGLEPAGTPPDALAAEIRAEVARWRPLVKALHLGEGGDAGRREPPR